MKITKITTTAYEIHKGKKIDTIIGYSYGIFFVKTYDGIMQYSISEMEEIYFMNELTIKAIISDLI